MGYFIDPAFHARLLQALALVALLLTDVEASVAASPASPVVVSSKLSSESAMIGQMIRLLLEANRIPTVDRMALGATPIVRKALLAGPAEPREKDKKRGETVEERRDRQAKIAQRREVRRGQLHKVGKKDKTGSTARKVKVRVGKRAR